MTGNNHYYIFGESSNVENIEGNARTFLGQVHSPSPVNQAYSLPPSMATKVRSSDAADDRSYDEGSASNSSQHNESVSALAQSLNELALDPVSFQTQPEVYPSATNGNRVEERRCEPREEHYKDCSNYIQKGDIVRIWRPMNTDVHLTTFLVLNIQGTNMICLRIVHRDPREVGYGFSKDHAKLKVEKYIHGAPDLSPNQDSDSCRAIMNESQDMKENCWINLLIPENIDSRKEYKFVRCGQLDDDSFERAKAKHLRLYAAKLR
ncbi:hypothetical protein EV356DRAFT_495923 [Viridothelium virens]|uniref:Uncharacterized protein n=1 Tax=Viridothelium virens TaxID=1048519 RepID=A0A6A6HRA4_VIRVR|nr:hypothetical protein EV356DRAFT_495923 [Viridothelium virens]